MKLILQGTGIKFTSALLPFNKLIYKENQRYLITNYLCSKLGFFFLTEYFYFNWDETSQQLFLVVEPFLVVSILN